MLLLLLQVNQTLPFRSDGYKADTKDVLAPNPCVAGQLGPTAESSSCKVELKATGALWNCACMHMRNTYPVLVRSMQMHELNSGGHCRHLAQ
jgi:hypothetical protein